MDCATRVCLAAAITGATTSRDARGAIAAAIGEAERLLGGSLEGDCTDPVTGDLVPLVIVTDNGPASRSIEFGGFVRARPFLRHVRTRHHAPETNGVVERFFGALKHEHLHPREIRDVVELAAEIDAFRALCNGIRPHEALGFATPLSRHLADPPEHHLSEPPSVQTT